jgi:hypothetical protein
MDLGSGIRNKPIPDTGSRSRGQKGTGSRIPDPDPQHCLALLCTKEVCPNTSTVGFAVSNSHVFSDGFKPKKDKLLIFLYVETKVMNLKKIIFHPDPDP